MGSPTLGFTKGKALLTMVNIAECLDINCPSREDCEYSGKGRCKVELTMISRLYNMMVDDRDGIGDKLNQLKLNRIGIILMPLYHQLSQISREILALKGKTTYLTPGGKYLPYPQLKEFRETARMIDITESQLGLDKIWEEKFGERIQGTEQRLDDVLTHGLTGSYEEMAALEAGGYEEEENEDDEDEMEEEEAVLNDPHELAEQEKEEEENVEPE